MALSIRTLSIAGSLLISAVLVAGAFLISTPYGGTNVAGAESSEKLLREYAEKDTDADGLPDWQETLYHTDIANAHSVDPKLTDKEALVQGLIKPAFVSSTPDEMPTDVPGVATPASNTLTDRFTREFYSQYLSNRGANVPTSEQIATFAQQAVQDLEKESAKAPIYRVEDLPEGGSGANALTVYANALRNALNANSPSTEKKDALENFSDFVNGTNKNALVRVKTVGTAYQKTADALVKIPVPTELRYAHLQLLNSYSALAEATLSMAQMDTDPLLGFIGLKQYGNAHKATAQSALDVGQILSAGLPKN